MVWKEPRGILLPLEIIEAIVNQVDDTGTLFSLLTVSSNVFELAVRQLYYDPFQRLAEKSRGNSASLAEGISLLRSLLLLLSPYEDVATKIALKVYGFVREASPTITLAPSPDSAVTVSIREQPECGQHDSITHLNYRINYLSLVRVFDIHLPEGATVRWFYTPNLLTFDDRMEFGELLDDSFTHSKTHILYQTSITWALVGHQLSQLCAIHIPAQDIERYIQHVKQFSKLQQVVFDMDAIIAYNYDDSEESNLSLYNRIIESCLDFTRLLCEHLTIMSPTNQTAPPSNSQNQSIPPRYKQRPISAEFYHTNNSYNMEFILRDYKPRLKELLPPLYKPRSLTSDNWDRFVCKANEVDLRHVEYVSVRKLSENRVLSRMRGDVNFGWTSLEERWGNLFVPRAAPYVLRACRSLRSLESEVDQDNFLEWAVEEKVKALQHELKMQSSPHMSPSPPTERSVRLAHVSLYCAPEVTLGIVNDTMRGFDVSIETAQYTFKPGDTGHKDLGDGQDDDRYHDDTVLGGIPSSPWILPRLRKLQLDCRSEIQLHPSAFDHCPQLKILHLVQSNTASTPQSPSYKIELGSNRKDQVNQPSSIPLLPAWNNLPSLRELVLVGSTIHSFHPQTLHSTPLLNKLVLRGATMHEHNWSSEPSSSCASFDLWTWDWTLPYLRYLEVEGPSMLQFDLVSVLQHSPRLQTALLTNRQAPKQLLTKASPVSPQNGCDDDLDHTKQQQQQQQSSDQSHPHCHRHLRSLTLTGAWRLTDDDIGQLVDTLVQRLAHLALQRGCKGYTTAGVVQHTHQLATFKLGVCETPVVTRAMERAIGLERRPPSGRNAYASRWSRVPTQASEFGLWKEDEDSSDDDDDSDGDKDVEDVFAARRKDDFSVPRNDPLDFPVYNFGGTQFWVK
ncbi:hypothetical protein BGZ73_002688 [Actinomortierella ambigua]|nr:hypothetical protein BGZ73_002688 [Actinomortierella ambigua]